MGTLRIGGDHTQVGTGRIVSYEVEFGVDATEKDGYWSGNILLLGGKRHALAGGVLSVADRSYLRQAVTIALNAEIDSLDLDALNAANGY